MLHSKRNEISTHDLIYPANNAYEQEEVTQTLILSWFLLYGASSTSQESRSCYQKQWPQH